MRFLTTIVTALVAVAVLAGCSDSPTSPAFAGGDCPAEAQRYTDGAGNYWCQLPNGSRYPTQ